MLAPETKRHLSATGEPIVKFGEEKTSSDRSFGLVFSGAFTVITLIPLLRHHAPRIWALPIALVFLVLALISPRSLGLLNKAWTWFGNQLQKITSPIIMGILFYLVLTPIAVLLRALGKDLLRLRLDRNASSYWIAREPASQELSDMRNQY